MKKLQDTNDFESVNCPNGCLSNDHLVMVGRDRLHGLPGQFSVVRCDQCHLERTNPRPTSHTIGRYYPDNYAPFQSLAFKNKPPSKLKLLAGNFFGFKFRQLPQIKPGRMLEVGCAAGGYMKQMELQGWKVEGIELAESAGAIAREHGFKVQTSSIENAKPPLELYDVIAAWMVLEHLHDPVKALATMKTWTKPSGYLVALVPDAKSLAKFLFKERCYDWQLPTHLFHYTPKTLALVLERAGWKLERVIWQKNCNTLLWSAEYWAEDMQFSKLVRIAKWLRTSRRSLVIRVLLGWFLGITHQSGRIELWARPTSSKGAD